MSVCRCVYLTAVGVRRCVYLTAGRFRAPPKVPPGVVSGSWRREVLSRMFLAIGETVILLQPLLPLLGVSIGKERERQQNDCLANG